MPGGGGLIVIDILLDANVPKRVKKLNHGTRVLHIGDVDTHMSDEEILHLLARLRCIIVTHDRELAVRAAKKHHVLFIKNPVPAEKIVRCLEKHRSLLRRASIFCDGGDECDTCPS
ncbi:DUF5615 family PIN-like protein [Candidatus Pyrohabitans sp.]